MHYFLFYIIVIKEITFRIYIVDLLVDQQGVRQQNKKQHGFLYPI